MIIWNKLIPNLLQNLPSLNRKSAKTNSIIQTNQRKSKITKRVPLSSEQNNKEPKAKYHKSIRNYQCQTIFQATLFIFTCPTLTKKVLPIITPTPTLQITENPKATSVILRVSMPSCKLNWEKKIKRSKIFMINATFFSFKSTNSKPLHHKILLLLWKITLKTP